MLKAVCIPESCATTSPSSCSYTGPSSHAQFIPGNGPRGQGSLWIEEREGRIKVLDIKGVCDDGIDTLEPQLGPICEWIDRAREEGGKVLVHCRVGVSRIPVGLITAALGLYTRGLPPGKELDHDSAGLQAPWEEGGRGKYTGKPFFVFGAASSVGQFVVQLARLSGFSPIIATASPHNADFLRSLGVTHVLDRKLSLEQLRAEIAKITKEPLNIIYDAVSLPETQLAAYELLEPGGTLVLVLYSAIPAEKLASEPKKRVVKAYGQANFPRENLAVAAVLYK
ncbi:hypothetical protein EVJ58_g10546, partial [Rhodofomes roseus]